MKSITVKLDDETLKQVRDMTKARGFSNQSELVRYALKAFLARQYMLERRKAILDYAIDTEAQAEASRVAEEGIGDLSDYIRKLEEEND